MTTSEQKHCIDRLCFSKCIIKTQLVNSLIKDGNESTELDCRRECVFGGSYILTRKGWKGDKSIMLDYDIARLHKCKDK